MKGFFAYGLVTKPGLPSGLVVSSGEGDGVYTGSFFKTENVIDRIEIAFLKFNAS